MIARESIYDIARLQIGGVHMAKVMAACVFALLAIPTAEAQVQRATPDYKVVEHGSSVKMGAYGSYNPDCSSLGRTSLNLVSPPQGGTVEIAQSRDYPSFAQNNVRFHCDSRKLPAVVLYYRASRDFVGTDRFTVEVVFGDGSAHQNTYTVTVR